MTTPKLIKLDEIALKQHVDLEFTDHCYYWRIYTPNEKFNFSETNQLIKNFKISPKEPHRLTHKQKAIRQIANEFSQVIPNDKVYENYIFVPIPPSKPETHPEHDDRLIQVLKQVQKEKAGLDFRTLIKQGQQIHPAHTVSPKQRPTVQELCQLYRFNQELCLPAPKKIIIFDDVLTKGSHFKATQKILSLQYPQIPIVGLFIALSTYDSNT